MVVITDERFRGRERYAEPGRPRSLAASLAGAARAMAEMALAWQERLRQRRHLDGLDDRLLKDIGLSRADVAREVDKPFWRD